MNIDFSKSGATTIISCGITNAGHYIYAQQGVGSFAPNDYAKGVFDTLAKSAPNPPSNGWELCSIDLHDYKTGGKFYRIHCEYHFRKARAKYSEEVDITEEVSRKIYKSFQKAMYNFK